MGKALAKFGGLKRSQQLKKWQEVKDSIWVLSVDEGEVNRQLSVKLNNSCKMKPLNKKVGI